MNHISIRSFLQKIKISVLLAVGCVLFGCASSSYSQIRKVKPGMDKTAVLDLLGSPNQTRRRAGHDIWTYIYYDDEVRKGADVFFSEGKVNKIADAKLNISEEDDLVDTGSLEEYEKMVEKQRLKRQKAKSN
ncbi:MAG: outer membrane protein assembly factor BamE [Pseudobdellovibrionaceae bacterium]|nr:outer membrane protein assembly factor BamE [Bdellovibrionales bacterium]USN46638.1 MAG: outer membrane protein assembly factor BamE [Pseudobdellovibrionaceae bacterium]